MEAFTVGKNKFVVMNLYEVIKEMTRKILLIHFRGIFRTPANMVPFQLSFFTKIVNG